MSPRMNSQAEETTPSPPYAPEESSSAPALMSHSPSQAEAAATQVEASRHGGNRVPERGDNRQERHDDEDEVAAPSTPSRSPPPARPVRQESAIKRLGKRLRLRARRSYSAPPAPDRRRRKPREPLIDQHFRVDRSSDGPKALSMVLPGLPHHEDNWARDLHDFFNLMALVPVVALNFMNWNWDLLSNYHRIHELNNIRDAWEGDYFGPFFTITALYFVTDLLWICIVPNCVRSPGTIVQHHLATLLYILVPYRVPEVRWCMGACMIVEFNTWFLIARRVFNKQGFPPWTIINWNFVSLRIKLISILFYITWIGIRCILYPYLLFPIWEEWTIYSQRVGTPWNMIAICVPLHTVFCLLNLKWSYDLLMSKVRYWRRRGNYNDDHKDKGL